MPRTVTVRLSVVLALVVVAAGGGIYYQAAQDNAPQCPERSGFTVEPTTQPDAAATNFSELPRDQRALFLLAVEPGETGEFWTPDENRQALARELPPTIRYDGALHEVEHGEPGGWAIQGALPVMEWLGIALVVIGSLLLFGLEMAHLTDEQPE